MYSTVPRSQQGPGVSTRTDQIEALLRKRGYHLLDQTTKLPRFTFYSPHVCEDCQHVVIKVSTKNYSHDQSIHYSATLGHTFEDAVNAASRGCALYAHLLQGLGSVASLARDIDKWEREHDIDTIESLLCTNLFRLTGNSSATQSNKICWLKAEFGTWNLPHGSFDGWTTAGDPAAKYIDARPYELDVNSKACWNFARRCLDTCRSTHQRCRGRQLTRSVEPRWQSKSQDLEMETTNISDVPSRLLHIPPNESSPVGLLDVSSMTDDQVNILHATGFTILSYCWGRQQAIMLTQQHDQLLRDGVAESDFHQTIADAIYTTRELKLQYLWVDALCIYQDSEEDKAIELPRMATYYNSATVTICAATASDCTKGFIHCREEPCYRVGPIRLALSTNDAPRSMYSDDEGHVYLLCESRLPFEPTTTRGWTMQQSLLSRRLLIYAERQLYWYCVCASAGAGGSKYEFHHRLPPGSDDTLVRDIHPISDLLTRKSRNVWQSLLINYSERHLGVSRDKLPAISALATYMIAWSRECGEKVTYVAGMPIYVDDDMSWLDQLLWYTLDLFQSSRPREYRAPSWSWAAVDGRVLPNIDRSGITGIAYGGWEAVAKVEGYDVELVHENVPFGAVKSGHLSLEAKILPLSNHSTVSWELPTHLRLHDRDVVNDIDNDESARLEILPDTVEDVKAINNALADLPHNAARGEIFLLLLQINHRIQGSLGLVVSRTSSGVMRRLGVFHAQQREVSSSFDAGKIFGSCTPRSIRLV